MATITLQILGDDDESDSPVVVIAPRREEKKEEPKKIPLIPYAEPQLEIIK